MEIVEQMALLLTVNFIDRQKQGFAATKEQPRQLEIRPGQLSARVHDHDDGIGVLKRNFRLPKDLRRDERFVLRNNATGINNAQASPAPSRFAVYTVARNTGFIANNSPAGANDTIE
jgi:hypothetical protein